MIDPDLLKMMCCPETHQELSVADDPLLARLNAQIASQSLRNRSGKIVTERADGGLVRADGKFLYPIRSQIPIMLVDEAIPLG